MNRSNRWRYFFLALLSLVWNLGPAYSAWDQYEVLPTSYPLEGVFEMSFISPAEGWGLISPAPLRVVHTSDGGMNWIEVYRNQELSSLPLTPAMEIQFISPTEGWMTPNATWAEDKLFHSVDSGASWTEVTHPFQSTFGSVRSVFFASPQVGWIAGEDSSLAGMIAATTDGGSTWTVRPTPYQFAAGELFFLDDQHGWVVGRAGSILFTKDGGRSWEMGQAETLSDLWCVRFADSKHGWAAGSDGTILYCRDGGLQWYPQSSGTSAELYDIAVLDPQEALITGTLDFLHGVAFVTRNGGVTWRKENLPSDIPLYAAARIANDVWLGGGGTESDKAYSSRLFHRKFHVGEYPVILVDELPGGTVGIPYEYRFTARDGTPPYSWSILGQQSGNLTVDEQTGLLSGVPIDSTEIALEVQVTDSMGRTDARSLKIHAISESLSFRTSVLEPAVHRSTYRSILYIRGGHPPYHWRLLGENLPGGMSVDGQSVLVGTPLKAGSFDFAIEVTDNGSLPQQATAEFHLEVTSLAQGGWEVQHANNRITDIHFFDQKHGVAIGWSGLQYETLDGGRTWRQKPLGAAAWDFEWVGAEGWMLSSAGIGHTTDQAQTWTFQSLPLPDCSKVRFLDPLHGWVCGNGIAYTEDGGTTWQTAETPAGFFFGLGFRDALHGFAGGNNFAFASSIDGGRTWQQASLPAFSGTYQKGSLVNQPEQCLAGKTANVPQIKEVYFLDSQVGWIGTNVSEGYSALLYYTNNGGQEWVKKHVGGKGTIDQFQFLPDGQHGWMGGLFSGEFYRTTDGGANWESLSFGSSCHILGFHFLDQHSGWVLPNVVGLIDDTNTIQDLEGSIWASRNGGSDFHLQCGWPTERPDVGESFPEQYLSPGPKFLDVSFTDAEHGWALGAHTFGSTSLPARVFFTDCGGADWRVISTLEYGVHQICFPNDLHGFALYVNNRVPVFETVDGGKSWFPRRDIHQLVDGGFDANWGDIVFADDQFGWIVYNGDDTLYEGVRILLRTTDGGNTWERINDTASGGSHYLYFLDRKYGWIVNNFGFIEATRDGGKTWEIQRDINDGWVKLKSVHFADEFSGWAVGESGAVLSTTSGGEIWTNSAAPASTVFNDVYFSTCQKGWFAGEDLSFPSADTIGNPVLIETDTGGFDSGTQTPINLMNHNLRVIDSPDTMNVWAMGDLGLGLKYAAPTAALQIVTPSVPPGRIGLSYSTQLENENGAPPYTWRICGGALPPGVSLQPSGHLVGVPTASATFRFVAAVFDSEGESAGKRYSLRIEPERSPSILTEALPDGEAGQEYSVILEATGTQEPYEWSHLSGSLPPGTNLLRYGAIGGMPTTPGAYTFAVLVVDSQTPCGSSWKLFDLRIHGSIASPLSPCAQSPVFCLALHWGTAGGGSEGDFDGDGDCDAVDAIRMLGEEKLHRLALVLKD